MDSAIFKQKTITALKWNFISKILIQGVSIFIAIILSRLLSPKEFGLIAMVNVLIGFLYIFQDFGLGSALIQRKEIDEAFKSTVFWFNIIMGTLLTILILLSTPLIISFYDKPILKVIIICLSFNFFIGSFNVVQFALIIKHLDFKRLFYIRFTAIITAAGVAILLALNGYGVWSLVLQSMTYITVTTLILWFSSSWRPKFLWSKLALQSLLSFSFPLLSNQTINYWVRNLDKILIGKMFGDQALGFYEKGYTLMLLPLTHITRTVSDVMFPSLSIIHKNKEQVKAIFLKMNRVIALATFPIMLWISSEAESFVLVILGDTWTGTIPVLRILAFVGMIQSVSGLYGNLYLSQGATKIQFKLGLILKVQTITWILIGLNWGITGVATTYLIAVIINQIPQIYVAGGLVGIKVREYLGNLSPVFFCNLVLYPTILVLDRCLLFNYSHWIRLISTFVIGVGGYVLMLYCFRVKAYGELKDLIKATFYS